MKEKLDVDIIYLHAKYPYKSQYQFLIKERESKVIKHFNDSEAFTEDSNGMDDICKNIEEYNPNKKPTILIIFDDMMADMLSKEKT